ncbi:hypothetical protein M5K25_011300 [Dendrobium thyrsiflorum]|uniref:Uncharacterized protein n=1 Tax=Dendrobium thyrsiflorum TaxID=117978 RepID=A0ABD0V2V6_DENTH
MESRPELHPNYVSVLSKRAITVHSALLLLFYCAHSQNLEAAPIQTPHEEEVVVVGGNGEQCRTAQLARSCPGRAAAAVEPCTHKIIGCAGVAQLCNHLLDCEIATGDYNILDLIPFILLNVMITIHMLKLRGSADDIDPLPQKQGDYACTHRGSGESVTGSLLEGGGTLVHLHKDEGDSLGRIGKGEISKEHGAKSQGACWEEVAMATTEIKESKDKWDTFFNSGKYDEILGQKFKFNPNLTKPTFITKFNEKLENLLHMLKKTITKDNNIVNKT